MNLRIQRAIQQAAPGDGAPAGGGGGGDAAAQAAAAAAAAAASGGGGDAANKPWFPDSHKSLVETKGWKTSADALTSYQNLETLIGAEKAGRTVVLPKDDKDVEGTKAFRAKLGVPESADKYELPMPEGTDPTFAKAASDWFHKAGIPKTSAQGIVKEWNAYVEKLVKEGEAAEVAASKQAADQVRAEWGADAPKKEEFARRAFRQVLGEDKIAQYEKALGTAEFLKLAALIGDKIAEPGAAGEGGGGGSFSPNKATAQAKLDEMRLARANGTVSDAQWKANEAERERLAKIVSGEA